jgi:hypothetical protein
MCWGAGKRSMPRSEGDGVAAIVKRAFEAIFWALIMLTVNGDGCEEGI